MTKQKKMGRLLDEDDVVDWLLKRTEMYDATGHFVDESVVKKNIESLIAEIPSAQPETSRIEQELHGKTPEEQYKFLYWLLLKFGLAYTDSRLAVIEWLRGEKEDE